MLTAKVGYNGIDENLKRNICGRNQTMFRIRPLFASLFLLGLILFAINELTRHEMYYRVDYESYVYAARHVWQGESPYLESRYIYTPLLAYLIIPLGWVSDRTGYELWRILSIAAIGYGVYHTWYCARSSRRSSGSPPISPSMSDKLPPC